MGGGKNIFLLNFNLIFFICNSYDSNVSKSLQGFWCQPQFPGKKKKQNTTNSNYYFEFKVLIYSRDFSDLFLSLSRFIPRESSPQIPCLILPLYVKPI